MNKITNLLDTRVLQLSLVAAVALFGVVRATSALGQQEKAANKAESSPAAQTAYFDAVSYQNKMAYELAAEEWARFLARFPDDPLATKATHYRGVCLVKLKLYAKAVNLFNGLIAKHPKFELLENAYLNLGWSQYCLGRSGDTNRYAQAVETFGKLEEAFPQGRDVDQAIFFRAEALYALGRHKDAALAYGKLVTNHKESAMRPDALYALGFTLEEISQWKQAIKSYRMFLDDYGKNDLADEVRLRLAEATLSSGDVEGAESLFAKLSDLSAFPAADYALMREGYCLERQEKDLEAAKLYMQVLERFPKSEHKMESALSAARCQLRADQPEQAAEWFDRTLAMKGPGRVEAAHWRCTLYLKNGQPEQAIELAEQVLADASDPTFVPDLRLNKADALYQAEGRRKESIQEYLAIADEFAEHRVGPVALYDAAFAALDEKQYQQAAELANRFLSTYPEHRLTADVRYVAAECKIQNQAYDEAEAIYRQIVSSSQDHPELPTWRVRLGLVLSLQKEYEATVQWLAPLVDKLDDPATRAEALHLVGVSKFHLQDYQAAAEHFRKSLLADAGWSHADETLLYLARSQRNLNQILDGLATLESLLEGYPKSDLLDQVYYRVGELRYANNDFPRAIAAYDRVLAEYPKSAYVPLALYGKGWSQLKSAQVEPAIATFSTLLEQHPDYALADEAVFARGMSYRQAKKYVQAVEDISAYLATDPEGSQAANALYERGMAEAGAEQYGQAVKTFNELLKDHADYEHADKVLYELAWAHRALDNSKAATEAFAKLAKQYGESPLAAESQFHVAENAYAAKDYSGAAQAYAQAASAANESLQVKVRYKLGWSYYQLKKYDEAQKQFEALLEVNDQGSLASDAWFMKGECLFRTAKYELALAAYRQAITLEPSSPLIAVLRQLHAGQAAGQLEKWQESLQLLDPIIAEHRDSAYLAEAHFERGQAKLKLGQLEEAKKDYQAAADNSRGLVGVRGLVMIGEIEFQQKKFEEAIKDFQRAMFRAVPDDAPPELLGWQAKAGFEAGRCAEAQIAGAKSAQPRAEHIANAKKFYQYVVQTHPQHELAASASKRLAELARLIP